MNYYVKKMKGIIESYAASAKKDAEIIYNLKTYGNAEEKSRINTYLAEMDGKYTQARIDLDNVREEAMASVDKWAELKGNAIDNDINLLTGHFNLSVSDLDSLIVKHRDNATMLRAIEEYLHDHNDMMVGEYIPTKADLYESYASLISSAMSLVSSIHDNVSLNEHTEDWMNLMVENWGNNAFTVNPATKLILEA